MFKFRAKKRKDGEYVEGHYVHYLIDDNHVIYAQRDGINTIHSIIPETLSISIGKLDSTGTEIFASFPLDGVMTNGGDVVEVKGLGGEKYGIRYSSHTCSFTMHRINPNHDLTCHISNIDSQDLTINRVACILIESGRLNRRVYLPIFLDFFLNMGINFSS